MAKAQNTTIAAIQMTRYDAINASLEGLLYMAFVLSFRWPTRPLMIIAPFGTLGQNSFASLASNIRLLERFLQPLAG